MLQVEYHTQRLTLNEAMRSETFPFFVRTCDDFRNSQYDVISAVPKDTLIYVEARRTIQYVHVKVLDLHDEQQAQQEHYDDFVAERGIFVGEELLVPLQYPGKLKYVHRPGKTTRYASIAQVLEDMPRLLRVDEDVVSVPPGGSGQNTLVPTGSRLIVRKMFTCSLDNSRYLSCSAGPATYSFNENARVNFTAIPDNKTYTLGECVKNQSFRSVIQFVKPPPSDFTEYDDITASNTITIMEGPIEFIGTVNVDVLIGWVRDKQFKSYKTLFLPSGMWYTLMVQKVKLEDDQLKASFRQERYKYCPDSEFVENTLYVTKHDQTEVIWLKSPKLYLYSPTDTGMKKALNVGYEDSDGEADTEYQEVPPPLPERDYDEHTKAPDEDNVEVVKKAQHKKKFLFAAVHRELKSWFTKPKQSQWKYEEVERSVSPVLYKSLKKANTDNQRPLPATPVQHSQRDKRPNVQRSMSERTVTQKPGELANKSPRDDTRLCELADVDYDYPPLIPGDLPPPLRPPPLRSNEPASGHNNTFLRDQRRDSTPSTEVVASDDQTDSSDGDYLNPVSSLSQSESPTYFSVSSTDMQPLLTGHQTSEGFYKLTVMQVYHLFKYCHLEHVADISLEQRLDGAFFKGYDLEEMRKKPFYATGLQVTKIKHIIYEGWRPKLE